MYNTWIEKRKRWSPGLDVSQILHSSKSIDPGGVSEEGDHPFSKLVNIYTPPIFFIPKAILFFNNVHLRGCRPAFWLQASRRYKGFPGSCGPLIRDMTVRMCCRKNFAAKFGLMTWWLPFGWKEWGGSLKFRLDRRNGVVLWNAGGAEGVMWFSEMPAWGERIKHFPAVG